MNDPEPNTRQNRLTGLPQRLRLVFGMRAAPALEQAESDQAEFVAFAADCRIFGTLTTPAGRMSDLLNAHDGV